MPQSRVAKQHGFRVASITDKKVRDLSANTKTLLEETNSHVIYNILVNVENIDIQEKHIGSSRQRRNIEIRLS